MTTLPTIAQPDTSLARPAVLIVYAAALLHGVTLVSFPAVSAVLKQVLALTDADYGAIFLPQVALAIVGAIAGGTLARTIGLKALLALALAANATSQVLLALAALTPPGGGFVLLFFGTAALGLGFGLIGGPINTYPALLFPRHSQPAIVAAHTLIGLGLAVGPLIAGPFINSGAWYGFPVGLAAACALAAASVLLIPLPRVEQVPAAQATASRPLTSTTFWLFAAITVLYAFAEGTFSSWAVIFLRDGRGLPAMTASYALSAFWGALVVGRLLAAVLVARLPATFIWIALPLLMIVAFWFVSYAGSAVTGIGAFALAGLACSAFLPITISLAVERFPHSVAWVSSMLIAALMAGVGVGSYLIGLFQMMLPLDMLYRLSSLYPALVLVLVWAVLSRSNSQSAG